MKETLKGALGLLAMWLLLPLVPVLAQTRVSGAQTRIVTRLSTSTTDTLAVSDCGKLISYFNSSAIAVTLPIASALPGGCWFDVQNTGAGTLTITPAASTIDGAVSLDLTTNQGVQIVDATDRYLTQRGQGQGSSSSNATGGTTYSADGSTLGLQGTTFSANTAVLASRITAAQAVDTTCVMNSGSSSAYVGAMRGNALTTYADGMRVTAEVDMTTTGGAITLDCGAGPKTVYQYDGVSNPLATQWIAGAQVLIVYGGALNSNAGGWRILSGGGGGGVGVGSTSSAITTTLDLPVGGNNGNALGCYPEWGLSATTYPYCMGYSAGRLPGIFLGNSGAPFATRVFIWPSNWDSSTPVNVLITWTGSYNDGNGMKLAASLACVTSSLSNLADATFGPATSSASMTNTYFYRSVTIAAVDNDGCAAGQLGVLKLARDNTITPNSADALGIVGVALQWTSH